MSSTLDETSPHDAPSDGGDGGDDEVVVLPWWQSPLNLVVLAIAIAVLAGGLGYVIGNNSAIPDPNETDVGFLQDMRVHHEQAVQMSQIYLDRPEADADLRTIANEIIIGQSRDIGRMIQLLRGFGESEINETDVAMQWMDEPVPLDRMPGMATSDDIDALRRCTDDCDEIFVQLMSAHHEGGLHMAEHAETHASDDEVRLMASQIVKLQTEEITEMEGLLAAAQG